ncbi:hypothetical protein GCK32_000849 [Trichostrongylus colubriformis]|uniref:Uncharacterized protein n=1 Tax=Trichostrongylus colubriformis TaxID=6319 RepID=A0AAN8FYQ1_TRICO
MILRLKTLPDAPSKDEAFVSVINAFPSSTCNFDLKVDGYGSRKITANNSLIDDKDRMIMDVIRTSLNPLRNRTFSFSSDGSNCPAHFEIKPQLEGGKSYLVVLTPEGWAILSNSWKKSQKGRGQFVLSLIHLIPCEKWKTESTPDCTVASFHTNLHIAMCLDRKDSNGKCTRENDDFYAWSSHEISKVPVHSYSTGQVQYHGAVLHPKDLLTGTYEVYYLNNSASGVNAKRKLLDGVSFTKNRMGGVYAMVITGTDSTYETLATTVHTIAPENRVSILWQIPQYFVITVAEILFSVSGLEFAYQEASVQMKAVVQAIWLLTNAIGNIIIMAIGISAFTENLAVEMFVFAAAMAVVMIVFILLAAFYYEYRSDAEKRSEKEPNTDSADGSEASASTTRSQ